MEALGFMHNFPFFSIVVPMFCGIISLVLSGKNARRLCFFSISFVTVLSGILLFREIQAPVNFTYWMGHFPAPWGNEIRGGLLEAFLAFCFSFLMLLCLAGGITKTQMWLEGSKLNMFYILTNLLLSSLMALVYTNDLFTAYVFIEINTIAAAGLIMIRPKGRNVVAAIRYMVMSSLGSGLFLMGLCTLYGVTGHLLMENTYTVVQELYAAGQYTQPLTVAIGFMGIGLAVKSALFPFHSWVSDSYGYSTPCSSAMLSSLVSKAYIVLLIKLIYRVIGVDVIHHSHLLDILFVLALIGMIMGSVSAIRTTDVRRMVAFSSVAQIGYIYMGIGLGTEAGMAAAVFHIVSHGLMKALLFLSVSEMTDSDRRKDAKIKALKGGGFRHPIPGAAYTIASLSMVGIPFMCGFGSKYLFAYSAAGSGDKMLAVLICLSISTILNAMYFLRTCIILYSPAEDQAKRSEPAIFIGAAIVMCICIFGLGIYFNPVVELINTGLSMFGPM